MRRRSQSAASASRPRIKTLFGSAPVKATPATQSHASNAIRVITVLVAISVVFAAMTINALMQGGGVTQVETAGTVKSSLFVDDKINSNGIESLPGFRPELVTAGTYPFTSTSAVALPPAIVRFTVV